MQRYWSYILLLVTVVIISFLHSKPSPFRYEFEQGQAWLYPDLIAPFDFAIEKSKTEIKRDEERIIEQTPDFYVYQENVEKDLVQHFLESFHNHASGSLGSNRLPENVVRDSLIYLNIGKNLLGKVYNTGIIHLNEKSSSSYGMQLIRNNIAEEQAIDQFYTIDEAAVLLRDSIGRYKQTDVISILPLLREALQPNIIQDEERTENYKKEMLAQLSAYKGMVRKNEIVVTKGSIVTNETYQKLVTLRNFYQKEGIGTSAEWLYWIGYFICTLLVFALYVWFLYYNHPDVIANTRQLSFLLLLILLYIYLAYWIEDLGFVSLYAIPFCIVPIIVSNFYGSRVAMVTHLVIILCISYLTTLNNAFAFVFIQCLGSFAAVLAKAGTRSWNRFFFALQYIFLAYFLSFIGLSLLRQGSLVGLDWGILKWLGISVFLTLLANPLIPIVERLFGYTSDISLLELNDLAHPLLKEMSINAPGTLQHSLQVANLGEAAASAIGANGLLVRVAALYHDIGKMVQPTFYIENQMGESPHDGMTAQESTTVILQHVTKGVKMAVKHRLPILIQDFIRTHHGTTRVEYFWRQHLELFPDADDTTFKYIGPSPRTREEAILMLADSVEAASKSLKEPTEADINALVDKIIKYKTEQKQLDNSTLSFRELQTVRDVFKKLLKSIYHVRIEYPNTLS